MTEKNLNTQTAYHLGGGVLALGIISIVGSLFYYVALPTGILAVILGAKGSKMSSKLAKAGMTLGIIGLSITVLIYVILIGCTILDYYS
jgi:hypothetical protein